MAYIQPNSTVMLLKGVSLDKDYNHTIYFDSIANQTSYFSNKVKSYNFSGEIKVYSFTNQTYQRVNKKTIRLAVIADEIYDCNYMMFQNTRFLNKWFYAFIDEVNYVNEGACEIVYTIDDMQTWYFDYELGKCFVEREHSLTDEIGENLVPEDVNTGEYIYHSENSENFSGLYMGGFACSVKLPTLFPLYDPEAIGSPFFSQWKYNAPCGVSSSLYIYGGFPIDEQAVDVFNQNPSFYVSSLNNTSPPPAPFIDPFANKYTLSQILSVISSGTVEGADETAIVTTFQVPMEMFNVAYMNLDMLRDNNIYTLSSTNFFTLVRPTNFKSTRGLLPYEPYNNKMLTYPYIKCTCTSLRGQIAEYKFEDFDNGVAGVRWIGTIFPNACLYAIPTAYKKLQRCYDESVSITDFPVPAWKGDKYGQWWNQQKSTTIWGVIGSIFSSALSLIGGGGKAVPQAGASFLDSVATVVAKGRDLSRTPPATYLQLSSNSLCTTAKATTIKLYAMCIKSENAEIIDEFFSMFGYATNKVKVPYVRDPNYNSTTLRPCWNYIKTNGCIIHQSSNHTGAYGLPSDAEANIARIYDNGITFWNQNVEVGTYDFVANTVQHIGGNNG